MDAFPAFFPLAGRWVVIVGEGEAAEAKARLFAGSPAQVVRIAGPAALASDAYTGAALVFVTGEDETYVAAAVAAARAAGVPVNAPDRPHLCDFTTPAIVDRGAVVAAIGTGGGAPMLATMLRHQLEAQIPAGLGQVAALFARLQTRIREALPEAHRRRGFLRAALSRAAADEAMLLAMLDETAAKAVAGAVETINGGGPAEALTLGQVRRLAAADVLVVEPGVDGQVLDLARRDAPRLTWPQDLEALAADGRLVIRLTA
ncbi:NAD(P)-dependent oxidoreductase [Phenylobacterium immobile]|uniref:NAD(P)-dependent oxidoreductase n=1 Tax=Phenylobacterium immobile TaxID=21 RepID=UPI000AD7F665|nr:NAD(P)-dependent oxidoreductase [Phenylobacterium immobile]